MALGSTQRLTEVSTMNLTGGKGRPARKADLTAICEPTVYKMWKPRSLTTLWAGPSRPATGIALYFYPVVVVVMVVVVTVIITMTEQAYCHV
jgi:hypothetical protein